MAERGPFNALTARTIATPPEPRASPWGSCVRRAGDRPRSRPSHARRLAVIGLSCALACTFVPVVARAIWPFSGEADRPVGERAAGILSRAIAIPTVNPPGDEAPLARYLLEIAKDGGLETKWLPLPGEPGAAAEDREPSRAIAWARLPGDGTAPPLVLLSHLDVVPADADDWSAPPFEGRIVDGHVVGRGALDAKGVAVIQLLAVLELARRDTPLARDVLWIATPDEETGGRQGAGWLVAEHAALLGGAEYLLTEGGNVRTSGADAPNVWGVSVTEKSPCWLELSARGTAGHSSTPSADAAVTRLVAALDAVRRVETRLRVLPEIQRMFAALAPLASSEDRAGYADLARALEEDRRFRRRFLANPARNALVRNTLAITVLEGAPRTNVVPSVARAHVDARLLPGERCDELAAAIANVVAEHLVSVETLLEFPSQSSPAGTRLYRAIERVARRVDPGALVVPRMSPGFTDAHWFRDLGIVAYGFVPRWLSADETRGIHGADERVSIENLERGVHTLVAILEELEADDRRAADQ